MAKVTLDSLKGLAARFRRRPSDVVGIDLAHSGVKVVHCRKADGRIVMVGAGVIPALPMSRRPDEAPVQGTTAFRLPRALAGRYGGLTVSGDHAVVKLLSFPGHAETDAEGLDAKVMAGLAVENPDRYRIGYKVIPGPPGRAESRILAVALPDAEARSACQILASGLPVPHTVEVSGLAAMTAFLQSAAGRVEEAVGLLEFGEAVTFFAIFHRGVPLLIRKFDVGSGLIMEKVQQSLGIDRATAQGIVSDGSFDISQSIGEVLDGFLKQIVVSRDFVERRENCRVKRVFVSGGMSRCRDWGGELKAALGYDVEFWNPFDAMKVGEGAWPESLRGQESRFAAAAGACLATLSEEGA